MREIRYRTFPHSWAFWPVESIFQLAAKLTFRDYALQCLNLHLQISNLLPHP